MLKHPRSAKTLRKRLYREAVRLTRRGRTVDVWVDTYFTLALEQKRMHGVIVRDIAEGRLQ